MNINFSWVDKEISDTDELKKYCSSEGEVHFCWWISGDSTGNDSCYKSILSLLDDADKGGEKEWQGNVYWVSADKNGVALIQPLRGDKYHFSLNEFREALVEWNMRVTKKSSTRNPDTRLD